MARARTGQLIWRKGWAYARVTTVIHGEKVRVCKALGTQNPLAAKRKLEKLNAADNPAGEDARRPETFTEAAERIYAQRATDGKRYAREDLAALRKHAMPVIGPMSVVSIEPSDINSVLDRVKDVGLSRQSVQNLKQKISNVFAKLRREPGGVKVNPVEESTMPDFPKAVTKERAVLTDSEFAIYLAWQHPKKGFQDAARERQTMACVARMFGGLRTSDLHALQWDGFDVEHGGFAWGYAPRQKTRRPQLLEVPELLRPILRGWWERHGQPKRGPVFPVRRLGRLGDRVGQQRGRVSHAKAFRHDLQRAFVFGAAHSLPSAPEAGSRRWRELFEETDYTLPVDFHSWRRAYAQALADADVNAQQAAALAGHADLGAHMRYLRNAGKMRSLPEAALPNLLPPVANRCVNTLSSWGNHEANAKGIDPVSDGFNTFQMAVGESHASEIGHPESERTQLRNRGSKVRIFPAAQENRPFSDQQHDEKANAMPDDSAEAMPVVTAIPARPAVRLLDLLAAIDAAVIAGDAYAARALIAEASRIERERFDAKGNPEAPGGTQ